MHSRKVSGEELEVLGKTAASKYLDGECKTLTEAVTHIVKKASLSPEQVRRVVEFANTDAFLREFKKEGSGHKVVDFQGGPADPAEILKDLNDGGGGTVFDRGTMDYHAPPADTKIASVAAETALQELFSANDEPLPYADPLGDVMDMRDKTAAAVDHLTSELSGLETLYTDLCDRVYFQVKQASLGGNSLGDIAEIMSVASPNEEYVKVAFQMMINQLLVDGVFRSVEEAGASMDKVATAFIINKNHPLVTEMQEYCACLTKMAELRGARDQLNRAYGELTHFVKSAGKEGLIPKAVRHVQTAAEKAAPHVGRAVGAAKKHLVGGEGNETRRTVESLVRNAPLAAGAAATLEGARRLSNDPTVRAVYHGANAHLNPLSDDYKLETMRQRGEI